MAPKSKASSAESLDVTVVYGGEHGEGWVPQSQRHLFDYARKTGQIDVPPLDDGGPVDAKPLNKGDTVPLTWLPPELPPLVELPPEPQPKRFGFREDA